MVSYKGSKMVKETAFYDVLGLKPNATANELRNTYIRLVDLHQGGPSNLSYLDFQAISVAFLVLRDQREIYDEFGEDAIKESVAHVDPYLLLEQEKARLKSRISTNKHRDRKRKKKRIEDKKKEIDRERERERKKNGKLKSYFKNYISDEERAIRQRALSNRRSRRRRELLKKHKMDLKMTEFFKNSGGEAHIDHTYCILTKEQKDLEKEKQFKRGQEMEKIERKKKLNRETQRRHRERRRMIELLNNVPDGDEIPEYLIKDVVQLINNDRTLQEAVFGKEIDVLNIINSFTTPLKFSSIQEKPDYLQVTKEKNTRIVNPSAIVKTSKTKEDNISKEPTYSSTVPRFRNNQNKPTAKSRISSLNSSLTEEDSKKGILTTDREISRCAIKRAAPSRKSSASSEKDNENPKKASGISPKPYNNRIIIVCNKCEDWFHGTCLNGTNAMEQTRIQWTCSSCTTKAEDKQQKQRGTLKKRQITRRS